MLKNVFLYFYFLFKGQEKLPDIQLGYLVEKTNLYELLEKVQ